MNTALSSLLRKLFAVVVAVALLGGAAFAAFIFVVQPSFTVSAPAGSTVTISHASSGEQVGQATVSNAPATFRIPAGDYQILVDAGAAGKEQFYAVAKPLQKQHYDFDAPTQLHATEVAKGAAYNVIDSNGTLSYLNTAKRIIESLSPSGTFAALDSSAPVSSFSSDNPGDARAMHLIAQNAAIVSSGGSLFVLRNNRLAPVNMSGIPDSAITLYIATNPTELSFVVAADQTLYYYSSPEAAPQKVLDLSKHIDQLAYGGGKVVAYSTRMPVAKEDIAYAYSDYAVDPLLIDLGTKTQQVLMRGPLAGASISPDGRYATLEGRLAAYTTLYDLSAAHAVYTTMNPDTAPLWLDGSHYVYAEGSDIWKADVSSQSTTTISSLPDGALPTSVSPSEGNTYYVTVYSNATDTGIFHLAVNGMQGGTR